jgi:hypothetical protein
MPLLNLMLLRLAPVDQLGQGWRHMDVILPIAKARIYNGLSFTALSGDAAWARWKS